MSKDYMYAVVEVDLQSVVNYDVSHWVFKTISEANDFALKIQMANPEVRFIVLHLNRR